MNIETHARQISTVLGDVLVRNTFAKLAQIEMEKCQKQMEKLKAEFVLYEKRFGINTDEAWKRYQDGMLGDDPDIMEWMMLFENYRFFEMQCERIRGIETQ